MSDRSRIRYTWQNFICWQESNETLRRIIEQDTNETSWMETMSIPCFGISPPMTNAGIEKLKALEGAKIEIVKEE